MSNNPSSSLETSRPKAEGKSVYQQMFDDKDFFLQKLKEFHASIATDFKVPIDNGIPLDLHVLFREVTSRGGIKKVLHDTKFGEINAALKFPFLRFHYQDLLYKFEQKYCFQKEEPPIVSDGENVVEDGTASDKLSAISNLEDGSLTTGVIDAKFDDGHEVTDKLGSKDLNVSRSFSISDDLDRGTKRTHQAAFTDPTHPQQNRSGYTFFFFEQHKKMAPLFRKKDNSINDNSITEVIKQHWNNLTDDEKQVYEDKAEMKYKSPRTAQG